MSKFTDHRSVDSSCRLNIWPDISTEKFLLDDSTNDIEILAQKQHTHNEAPCRPIEEKCHFFPSTLFNKTDVLIMKIGLILNCKEWPLQLCIIKMCLCLILNKQIRWKTSWVISKSVKWELNVFWHQVENKKVLVFLHKHKYSLTSVIWPHRPCQDKHYPDKRFGQIWELSCSNTVTSVGFIHVIMYLHHSFFICNKLLS